MSTGVMKKKMMEVALADLTADERKERDVIFKLYNEGEKADVFNKWKIGERVAKIHAMAISEKRGKDVTTSSVKKIAESMGVGSSTLDMYGRIATAWPNQEEFKKIMEMKTSTGATLGVTHFDALSRVTKASTRTKLLAQAIAQSMSKDDLNVAVQNLNGGKASNRVEATERTARPVSPKAGLQQFTSIMKVIQGRKDVMEAAVFSKLMSNDPAAWDPKLVDVLESAKSELVLAQSVLQLFSSELDAALDRGERILSVKKRKSKLVGEEEPETDDEDDDDEGEEEVDEEEVDEEDDSDVEEAALEDEEEDDLDDALPPPPKAKLAPAAKPGKAAAAIAAARARGR